MIGATLAPPARAGVDDIFWAALLDRYLQGIHDQGRLKVSGHLHDVKG
jgi:hypothetical protein